MLYCKDGQEVLQIPIALRRSIAQVLVCVCMCGRGGGAAINLQIYSEPVYDIWHLAE